MRSTETHTPQKSADTDSDDEDVYLGEDDVIDLSADESEEPVLPDAVLAGRRPKVYDPDDVKQAFKELNSRVLRRIVVQENRRSDGRSTTVSSCGWNDLFLQSLLPLTL